ncbi:hypothetical protein NX059_001111 [Plenodomus lindquistii]|nr:hypothetical protein NX059_001111 [Plenodomus lindquistii]
MHSMRVGLPHARHATRDSRIYQAPPKPPPFTTHTATPPWPIHTTNPPEMEARRDPRSFLFFIILLLLINSPEPQQPSFNVHTRFKEVLEREYTQLDILNRTRYGDFDAGKNRWLNITGLRDEDAFAWEVLGQVKERARQQSERWLGERWKGVLDGDEVLQGEEGEIPVYKNLSGYVAGEWVRSSLSRIRHPSDMGNSSVISSDPFGHLVEYDRNLTGASGPLRLHITELEDKMRRNENKSISEVSAKVVIGDDDSFGGNWWEFIAHGVHFTKSGTAILTTTSDRYAGIFALPHLQTSQFQYSTSQEFLNWTIHETIKRQESRVFPLWNPWTSSAEGSNEVVSQGHHCEFVLYLQEVPSQYKVNMEWLEHEMRYPTGAPIQQHAPFSMSMVGFSPDCGFVIESKGPPDFPPSEATHLGGSKTEDFNERARHSIIAFSVSLAFQLYFLINQMKETATPSMRSRVSFYTIAMMALGDGFTFLILVFMYLFLGSSQLALYSIAFMALFSVLTHLRFLMDIWSVQAAERARLDRQAASAAATSTPTPAPTLATPATTTSTPATAAQGPPLPATAPRPPARPPTPIIIAPDQDDPLEDDALLPTTNPTTTNTTTTPNPNANPRAELGTLYSRFCLLLILLFFVTLQFATARSTYRTVYFHTLSFIYLSFWVPQIYRNIMRNCRQALRWDYVVGTSLVRIAPVAYFYLKHDNVLWARTDTRAFLALAGWLWTQCVVLGSQSVLGARWCVPGGWAPEAWDYHPILREDAEGASMPLNITTIPTSPDSSPSKVAPETKKSTHTKIFDCSICAQEVEVPVIPAGGGVEDGSAGASASVAGMGGTTTFTSIFHNRAFTSHSPPAKNPTLTRSPTIPSNVTAQGETARPLLPPPGDPVGTIRASLQSHYLPKWGFLIYRCDYRSDAAWDSFMGTLHWNVNRALSILKATDLAASLDLRVQSDQSALDGASVDRVRDLFEAWVNSAEAKEETKHAPLDWGGADYPRYMYCVHVDADAVDSVVKLAPQPPKWDREKVGWVNLVRRDLRRFTDRGVHADEEEEEEEDDEDGGNVFRALAANVFGPETYGQLYRLAEFDQMRRERRSGWIFLKPD